MRAFLESSATSDPARPNAQRIETYKTIFADLGALTMVDAQVISPTQISVSANAARGGPVTLLVSIQADAPHRITGVGFERR